ncbi:MAG: hypothetical protein IT227_14340 [Flavobacteriales bacterium]|nr:hypothetical protein [Flavobacteriales bacterium]
MAINDTLSDAMRRISSATEHFRNEPHQRASYLVPVLLYFHHSGILKGLELVGPERIHSELRRIREGISGTSDVYDCFYTVIHGVDRAALSSAISEISAIEKSAFTEHYSALVQRAYSLAIDRDASSFKYYDTREDLAHFVISLAKLPAKASVYNPFSGFASLCLCLKESDRYCGCNEDREALAIGLIRCDAAFPNMAGTLLVGAPLEHMDQHGVREYDLVIADMVFTGDTRTSMTLSYQPSDLIRKALPDLKPDGKVIVVLETRALSPYRHGEEPIEASLSRLADKTVDQWLKEDLIDTIVSFPGGIKKDPIAVLVMGRKKQHPGKVRFARADRFLEKHSEHDEWGGVREFSRLDAEGLLEALRGEGNHDVVRLVPNDRIRENGHVLAPMRYFSPIAHLGEPLSEMIGPLHLTRYDRSTNDNNAPPRIGIGDLSASPLAYRLAAKNPPNVLAPMNEDYYLLDRSALLLAMRGGELRPTWFEYKETPIVVPSTIRAILPDNNMIHMPYLVQELNEQYVRDQVATLNRENTMAGLSTDDLLRIRVNRPSLEEQRKTVKERNAKLYDEKIRSEQSKAEENRNTELRIRYREAFAVCTDHYIGRDTEKGLLHLLKLEDEQAEWPATDRFNLIRKILEDLFKELSDRRLWPPVKTLNDSFSLVSGDNVRGYAIKQGAISPVVSKLLNWLKFLTQDGSHRLDVDEHMSEAETSYLLHSTTYGLMHILCWFKTVVDAPHGEPLFVASGSHIGVVQQDGKGYFHCDEYLLSRPERERLGLHVGEEIEITDHGPNTAQGLKHKYPKFGKKFRRTKP